MVASMTEHDNCFLAKNSETLEAIALNSSNLRKGKIKAGIYEHFKGKKYKVLGEAKIKSRICVVYKAVYRDDKSGDNSFWYRTKKMFFENVESDGKEVPRFRYVGK